MNRRNKKGSVTVFVCIFFITLVSLIFIFVEASKKIAVNSSTEALCQLWGQSILAEYDLNLQKRYNLFGFYGYPKDVVEKLDFYAGESFDNKRYVHYGGSRCSLYDFSLVDVDILKEQIYKAGLLAFTEKFRKPEEEIERIDGPFQNAENIFDDLPSGGSDKSFSVSSVSEFLKEGKSAKLLLKKGSHVYGQIQYIFSYFKDQCQDRNLGPTYLRNEIEYILAGKHSDSGNAAKIRNKIVAIREIINFSYLNKDAVKCSAAMAAAEAISPGPAAPLTQKAILAAWALAESINDYKLLINGHLIPAVKTEETWATDLDGILAEREEGCIYTGIDRGEDYEDYLKLFLCVMDERVRILRIMDLVQINMKYLYYDGFLLKEYSGGVRFVMTVNGEEHEVEKTYEKRQLSD